MARLNAEGQAADSNRRLQVAQEQVAEFAYQREEEAAKLLQQVDEALGSLHSSIDPPALKVLQVLPQNFIGFYSCKGTLWHLRSLAYILPL